MGVVNCSGKESSYGLCRARLVGSESPGYTQTRFDSLNELRFCVKFRAAVLQMGGRVFYAKYCNKMDFVWRCIHYRYRWKVEGTGDQRPDP